MTTVHRRTSEFPAFDAPPAKRLLALGSRALLEFAAGALLRRGVQQVAPRGDGCPVLVLPGLGTSDLSTRPLRHFLAGLHRSRATENPSGPRPGNDCCTVCATATLVPRARIRT